MSALARHNVHMYGPEQGHTLVFAHGYGCDQGMWRFVAPAFVPDYRVGLFDLAGCGGADPAHHDPARHASLHGHAEDLCDLLREFGRGPVTFVGHSVSAMIGALAALRAPELFTSLVMIGPSPCYLNDGDYPGGFVPEDIEALLDLLDGNHHAWAARMAPVIMGNPDRPELAAELEASFCRMDPKAARVFARVTFTSDCRQDLPLLRVPTLILQSQDDAVASVEVGAWVASCVPGSSLIQLGATGHCPHVSAPEATARAIRAWLG
ncbi:alpha/beta fold hydrolase [Paracraurococcus ruber]|uniref:Alpha/beta hydrolase n=1 Tax=Paracraurococcus ruber TaxID=77675 RepID=A0ABS1D456_9PROT|nr:alpha/beta hydrolase [Paracraurococcus ruber]MBK1661385.1 alpha/beta hydrolase [Paracraurococcus ruber]TDG28914.1 alpha/beta hydrolase [Paracraurococcus ruber]